MKTLPILIAIIFIQSTFAQNKVEDFGYAHHQIKFNSENVDFIVKSKKGDEEKLDEALSSVGQVDDKFIKSLPQTTTNITAWTK